MTTIGRWAVSAFLLATVSGGTLAAAQVTFTFNQEAPLSPIPKSEREFEAFLDVQEERNPERRLRLVTDFLSGFFDSEFRHLVLRLRFQARYALGDWEETIEAAREALAAEDVFREGKLGFIADPERLPEWPTFQLDQANQRMVYYQSMTEGYQALGDSENALMYADLALDAQTEAWELYAASNDETSPEYQEAVARHQANEEALLRTVLAIHRSNNDTPKVLEYGRRLLETQPDDLEMLMTVSQIMAQNAPEDPEARGQFLEEAGEYAVRAVAGMEEWAASEASAEVSSEQKAEYLAQAHSSLGMIRFQTADYAGAADAFGRAAEAAPRNPIVHYQLGVAYNNSQKVDEAAASLARAVFLGFAQARPALESVYQVKTGSLEGLDEFIESEGAGLTTP